MAKRRTDANIAVTVSKPTKKRANTKIVVMANETATANANKLASNVRKAYTNVEATAIANVMAITNKTTSNA